MSWNVISLAKDNFQRVRLIEAHNSLLNYDMISICETSINDAVELHEILRYILTNYIITESEEWPMTGLDLT